MTTKLDWPAVCTYFSIPFSFFLKHQGVCGEKIWSLLKEFKQWSSETEELQKNRFYQESAGGEAVSRLVWGDKLYPQSFERLPLPPACLYYHGDLEILKENSLSVIGSRQPSSCFLEWMDSELGAFLSHNKKVVVSGGARGIDQKSTQVALRHQQKCIIVLPCGLEELYPSELSHWLSNPNILFLTEYFPKQKMQRHHFIKRNRLVSALSPHLLVVQCAIKSGSMITVKYALEQEASIATVPDFPRSYESSGNLLLLKQGAQLVSDAQDLKDFTSW